MNSRMEESNDSQRERVRKHFRNIDKIEVLILFLVLVPHLFIASYTPETILDWFHSDDAYYYFVPARNIAEGGGITFDGITHTNGFHPLWMAINVPVFALAQFDLILPLRIMIIILAIFHAATGIVLFRLVKRFLKLEVATIIALYWVLSPTIHNLTAKGGMESGLSAFFILLFWYQLSLTNNQKQLSRNALGRILSLGFLASLTVFSRLDNIFLVIFGGIWFWLRWWQQNDTDISTTKSSWLWRFQTAFSFFAPVAGSMLIYVSWNRIVFETYAPISGSIKVWWGTLPFTVYGSSRFKHGGLSAMLNHLFSGDSNWGPWSFIMEPINSWAISLSSQVQNSPANLVYLVFFALVIIIAALLWTSRSSTLESIYGLGLVPMFFACLSQIGYYNLRISLAQRYWYWVMEVIMIILFGAVLLSRLFYFYDQRLKDRKTQKRVTQLTLFLIAITLAIINFNYLESGLRGSDSFDQHFYIERAKWLEDNTEPNALIAITGAGALSYFTEGRTIINMDGLMNNAKYFYYLQGGEGAVYLEKLGVDYIFGSRETVLGSSPYIQMLMDKTQEVSIYTHQEREAVLWRYTP